MINTTVQLLTLTIYQQLNCPHPHSLPLCLSCVDQFINNDVFNCGPARVLLWSCCYSVFSSFACTVCLLIMLCLHIFKSLFLHICTHTEKRERYRKEKGGGGGGCVCVCGGCYALMKCFDWRHQKHISS